MISSGFPLERYISPTTIAGAGVALTWLAKEPIGLLAVISALFLSARGRATLALYSILAIGLLGTLVIASADTGVARDTAVSWAAFFATSFCIGALISTRVSALTHADVGGLVTAQAGLLDGENKLQQLIDNVPAFIWGATSEGQPSYINKPGIRYAGLTVEDFDLPDRTRLAGAVAKLLHPDDQAGGLKSLSACFSAGQPFALRYRQRRADGAYRWTDVRAEPQHDRDGRIVQWYGVCFDIDDEIKAQEALRERERQLQLMVDAIPAYIWCLTPDGAPSYLNKRVVDHIRLSVKDLTTSEGRLDLSSIHADDKAAVELALDRSLATGEPFIQKYRQRRGKDGGHRWTDGRAEALRDDSGNIVQWYGVYSDIHDEVLAQQSLRERERELSQLVDMVPSHVWRLAPDGEPTFFNKRMVDYLGSRVEDMDRPGISRLEAVVETIHPDDAAAFGDSLRRCLSTGESFAMRYRLRRADGAYRWMSSRAEPMRDEDGRILHWYGLCHDIDDEMDAQEGLRRSEQRYRHLFHHTPVGLWQLDGRPYSAMFRQLREDGVNDLGAYLDEHPAFLSNALSALVIDEVNDNAIQMFGARHRDELLSAPTHWMWRESIDTLRRSMESRWRGEESFQETTRLVTLDGRTIDVLYTVTRPPLVEGLPISIVSMIDLTERVRAQEALRERERELSHLVDMVPSYLWRLTPEGEPNFYNKRLIDYFGVDVANADRPGMTRLAAIIDSAVHPDDATGVGTALRHSFATGEPFARKYRLRRADGAYRWVEGRAEPLRDEGGRILQWYGLAHDIDDHVRAEDALRESESALRRLVETLPAMIDCAAPDGEPIYRSRQLREFLGYNLEDLDETGGSRLRGTLDAGVHPDDLEVVKDKYACSLSTGDPYAHKHRLRRADGEYRWVETRAAAMRNDDGIIVQWNVICLDIEDQVRAQEELRLAQERLARASQEASLAELSASIAHEVNQPLAAVVANSHACQRWLRSDPPNLDRAQITVERIIRDANSAADVVSRIRALFRQSVELRNFTSLESVIAEARNLLTEDSARRRIHMIVNVERNLPVVAFDRIQIQQVLINLVRNGMDAMDAIAGDKIIGIRAHRDHDAIQVAISDRGSGVQHPDRIFDPFFTTKDNGMGMGLAICRSIVESHGGRLWVEKNEPHGAIFNFTLPIEVKAP